MCVCVFCCCCCCCLLGRNYLVSTTSSNKARHSCHRQFNSIQFNKSFLSQVGKFVVTLTVLLLLLLLLLLPGLSSYRFCSRRRGGDVDFERLIVCRCVFSSRSPAGLPTLRVCASVSVCAASHSACVCGGGGVLSSLRLSLLCRY